MDKGYQVDIFNGERFFLKENEQTDILIDKNNQDANRKIENLMERS